MPTPKEMVLALADAMGVPNDSVIRVLRTQQQALPTHDAEGVLIFHVVDSHSSDEALVIEAFRNIDTIRKVTGR